MKYKWILNLWKNIQPYLEWEIDTKIVLRFYFSHEIGKNNSVVNTDLLFFFKEGNLSFHILLIVIQIGLIFIEDNFLTNCLL